MSLLQMPRLILLLLLCPVLPQLTCGLGYNLVSALTNVRKHVAWRACREGGR